MRGKLLSVTANSASLALPGSVKTDKGRREGEWEGWKRRDLSRLKPGIVTQSAGHKAIQSGLLRSERGYRQITTSQKNAAMAGQGKKGGGLTRRKEIKSGDAKALSKNPLR